MLKEEKTGLRKWVVDSVEFSSEHPNTQNFIYNYNQYWQLKSFLLLIGKMLFWAYVKIFKNNLHANFKNPNNDEMFDLIADNFLITE